VMKGFWFVVFLAKSFAVLWVMMWIKWTMPRLRIDQVLNFGWKVLLPVGLANLLAVSIVAGLLRPHKTINLSVQPQVQVQPQIEMAPVTMPRYRTTVPR